MGRPAERHNGSRVAATLVDTNYCDAYFGRDSRLISRRRWCRRTEPAAAVPPLFNFSWDDFGQVQVREPAEPGNH